MSQVREWVVGALTKIESKAKDLHGHVEKNSEEIFQKIWKVGGAVSAVAGVAFVTWSLMQPTLDPWSVSGAMAPGWSFGQSLANGALYGSVGGAGVGGLATGMVAAAGMGTVISGLKGIENAASSLKEKLLSRRDDRSGPAPANSAAAPGL